MSALTAAAGEQTASSWVNPYAGHRLLSEKEQQVLGEYARLAATIKRVSGAIERQTKKGHTLTLPHYKVTSLSTTLSSTERHAGLLSQLRVLERKMGLVLTLFKASVWSLIQTHQDEMEEEEQRQQQQQQQHLDESQYSSYPSETADETVTDHEYRF